MHAHSHERPAAAPSGEPPVSRLYSMLAHNAAFVESAAGSKAAAIAALQKDGAAAMSAEAARPEAARPRRIVVVTCMDARLVELLPRALNLLNADAKVIKTAGAILTHPFGGIMRSVIVAIYALHAEEVYVIGHHDCGMSTIDPDATIERMVTEGGIPRETVRTLESAGINIHAWLTGFSNVADCVTSSVTMIRRHPLVPAHVPVHGLVIDPSTGRLELLVDGNKRSSRPVALLDSPETSEPLTVLRSPRAVAGSGVTGGGQRFSDVTEASISLTGRSGDFVEN